MKFNGKACPYFDDLYKKKRASLIKVLKKYNTCSSNGSTEFDKCIRDGIRKGVPEFKPIGVNQVATVIGVGAVVILCFVGVVLICIVNGR